MAGLSAKEDVDSPGARRYIIGTTMKELDIAIRGMTCQHCVMTVKEELSKLPGLLVNEVRVGSARVTYDEAKISPERITAAVEDAGFTVA
jgi:copper chaperone